MTSNTNACVEVMARAAQRAFCARVGSHTTCDLGETVYETVRDSLLEPAGTAYYVTRDDHDEFVNEVLRNAPDSWDDDASAEYVAVRYVHALEKRVKTLGGTLEKTDEWFEESVAQGE